MSTSTKPRRRKPKVPTVTVTLAKFDTREPTYRLVREGVPIADFKPLVGEDYLPSGGTPLRDAVARMIGHGDQLRGPDHVTIMVLLDESGSMAGNEASVIAGVNRFVDGMSDVKAVDPKAAGTVLAVIVTDGYENSSREVDQLTLQKLVQGREADGWTFIFLGADIDAWQQGYGLGLSGGATGQSVSYRNTPEGTAAAMDYVTADSMSYLSNVRAYQTNKVTSGTTMSSITPEGVQLTSNINAGPTTSAPPTFTATTPVVPTPYGNVEEALKKAKEKTS